MPWKEESRMSLREEFVVLASCEGSNLSELCRRFGVSRKSGYKWLARYRERGISGLADESRRPRRSPDRTSEAMEVRVLELRLQHPAWGGRKLRHRLMALGVEGVPSASTITAILRRHGQLDASRGAGETRDHVRFEHASPNDLWQMDFKGHFALTRGGRCHPLTVLDDHSRYSIGLRACGDERRETVQDELIGMFRVHGMPRRMLMDNGAPWGDEGGQPWTRLTAWLLRLGVGVSHGRPYHPQTQGKDERFHRTLQAEVLRERSLLDLRECQGAFDPFRRVYNTERPHEALGLAVPASRYRVSERSYPERLPSVEYGPDRAVRRVQTDGRIKFRGWMVRVGKAFAGEDVGVRGTPEEGVFEVNYCSESLGRFEVREGTRDETLRLERQPREGDAGTGNTDTGSVTYVSERL